MSSVALIMSDNPFAPNGAAGYMKRLYDSRELARSFGIGSVYLCHGGINFTNAESYVISPVGRAKQAVKNMLLKTKLGTKVAVSKTMFRRGQNAINMYNKIQNTPDAVIFNEFATHLLFMKQNPDYQGLKIQILHNNGEFGKMLRLSMPKIDPSWVKEVEANTLHDSDVIVHVGARNMDRFNSSHPECTHKSVHIHTGINDLGVNQTREPGDRLCFVCVGTVCSRKNQKVLLDVMINKEMRDCCYIVVVGGGPEYEFCKAKAAELGLSDAVRFVGPSSNVFEYYRNADAFLSVSQDEGLPTAALEAMSCGLPLVLTDVGSCSELIDGNGVLVSSCNSKDITAGIKKFLSLYDSEEISGLLSRKAFEQHYTTTVMWQEYASLIRNRLGAKQLA